MSTWTSSQLKYQHASITLGFNQGKIFIIKATPAATVSQICVKHVGFPYRVIQETRPWVVHHAPCSEMQIVPWRSRCSAGYRQEESERFFAISTFLHRGPLKKPKQFSLVQWTPWSGAPLCSDRGVALSPSSVGAFHSIIPSKGECVKTRVSEDGTLAESRQLVGYSGSGSTRIQGVPGVTGSPSSFADRETKTYLEQTFLYEGDD